MKKKRKVLDMIRVVDECNYERDIVDQRIVYEMIGDKLDPGEFNDETSESEGELLESPDIKYTAAVAVNDEIDSIDTAVTETLLNNE